MRWIDCKGKEFNMRIVVHVLVIAFCIVSAAHSQNLRWRGSSMWGSGSKYEMLFDNFNVQTFQGKITKIDTLTPMRDMSYGVMLVLQSGNEDQVVHLGPGWYIMYQDINLGVGNEVEVKGAPASIDGKKFIMAVEVSSKDKVLQLRDKDGIPYWVGSRKK
jgi:hypothetical protein